MARFRFKAVAPSSEVVEGELEANDRQAAIGRLRELNHLPVRVEEMREGPLRRRVEPERIEPRLVGPLGVEPLGGEPPRPSEPERPEPQLAPPPPEPPPAEPRRQEPPQPRSPIVRLREVLRGVVTPVRQEPIVAPPSAPETSAAPVLEEVPPPAPELPEPEPPEPEPSEPEPAVAVEPVAPEEPSDEWQPEPAPVEDAAMQPPAEVLPAGPDAVLAEVEPSVPLRLHVVAREDDAGAPADQGEAARVEPLPMRWDTTPPESTVSEPPVAEPTVAEPAPSDVEPESSADRWLREVGQPAEPGLDRAADDPTYPPEPPIGASVEAAAEPREERIEPVAEGMGRAVVPAAAVLSAVALRDLAPAREPEPEPVVRATASPEPRSKKKPKAKRARRALPPRLLPVFTRELQVLLSAGLPMDQALRIIVESTADDRVAAAADQLLARVRAGALLSEAMEALPEQFDDFLRMAVRAGEAGGSLAEVLGQVAQYQERGQALERSVKTAMIYPTILAFAAALSVTLLLTLVVPQFEALLRQSAQAPPLATRLVIGASIYLRAYGWIVPALGLVLWLLVRWRLAGVRGRARMHQRLMRLPLVGKVIAGVSVERLARALGTLLANGVALPEALPLVASAIPNRAIGAIVAAAAERVKQGERLADALEEGRVLPSLAVQLIRVGEEGGRLSEMLARVAEIYAGDVDVAVRRVTAVVEPVLILAIGIIVGGIVLSLLAAITGLNTLAL